MDIYTYMYLYLTPRNSVRNHHLSGNFRTLVFLCLEKAASLREQKECESNLSTWRVHNALFIIRVSLKHLLEKHSESDAALHLDGSTTIPQLTSLEPHTLHTSTPSLPQNSTPTHSNETAAYGTSKKSTSVSEAVSNPILESLAQQTAGHILQTRVPSVGGSGINEGGLPSQRLVEGVASLLCHVSLGPFTYDVHLEAVHLLLVFLSSQVRPQTASGIFVRHILTIRNDLASVLVHRLLDHVISQPPLPPHRSQGPGLISSVTAGLWSLVTLNRGVASADPTHSPLAKDSLLLLLVLTHQQAGGHNPYRTALGSFSDERGDKGTSSFSVSLEKIYLTMCSQLNDESHALLLYLLLQGNPNVASFIFSRSDIEQLVLPLLKQLHDHGNESSHHVYMLLIILLILSQDECFNKSIHEKIVPNVPWYVERRLAAVPLGSLMVMILIKTVQVNITHIRDKYLHTNCLAALANMSSHFHSLHLDAARKIVNLFKLLAKKHQRISERLSSDPSTPTTPTTPDTPSLDSDCTTDRVILEEVLQMVLEIINSCLTHNLHNNPHLIYSLLYQREIFEPYRSHPSLMDLVQNMETVVSFFSSKLEQSGPSPYSSEYVLSTIEQTAKAWPRNRLRLFPELKFRYVEEDQPEAFFIPYIWTLVFKHSSIYWDSSKVRFS
ncbi:dymeclin-like isoform X2 [Halichondria panicea]|uniref:dymeclin-like isoform X2 n=1 Tax=Halichondria panicea TaxID=6063 RepID=UPI00312B68B2